MSKGEELLELYLEFPMEELEISLGRILSMDQKLKTASSLESEDAKSKTKEFFSSQKAKLKEIICGKLELQKEERPIIEILGVFVEMLTEAYGVNAAAMVVAIITKYGIKKFCNEEE